MDLVLFFSPTLKKKKDFKIKRMNRDKNIWILFFELTLANINLVINQATGLHVKFPSIKLVLVSAHLGGSAG